MAHRCSICDYTEQGGSGVMGVNPGKHGRVRWRSSEFLCDGCLAEISENYVSLLSEDELEQLEEDTSTLSLWEKQ